MKSRTVISEATEGIYNGYCDAVNYSVKKVIKGPLTLRRLMSYIYIYMEYPFFMFLDHTQRRSTVGRTPLDE